MPELSLIGNKNVIYAQIVTYKHILPNFISVKLYI